MYENICTTTRLPGPLLRHRSRVWTHSRLSRCPQSSPLLSCLPTLLHHPPPPRDPTCLPREACAEPQALEVTALSPFHSLGLCTQMLMTPPAPEQQLRPSFPPHPQASQTLALPRLSSISTPKPVFLTSICSSTQSPHPESWEPSPTLPPSPSPTADRSLSPVSPPFCFLIQFV